MIVTLTPNPSIDATIMLSEALRQGEVTRACQVTHVAGGKGINVSHTLSNAQADTLALFPAPADDPFTLAVSTANIPAHRIDSPHRVRVNTTITEPGGVTTKLNDPGSELPAESVDKLVQAVLETEAEWVVLAGSLPPGVPPDFYVTLCEYIRQTSPGTRVAVDTSDTPLLTLGQNLERARPDLLKPNEKELAQLIGANPEHTPSLEEVLCAAQELHRRGVGRMLITLGSQGALLLSEEGAWHGSTPPTQVASTVGAGDAALAGYLLADVRGSSPAEALRDAIAFGSAAASLPGTTMPSLADIDREHTNVRDITNICLAQ